jgi:hypothetical protein
VIPAAPALQPAFFGLLRQPAHNGRALPCAINIKNKARLNFLFT